MTRRILTVDDQKITRDHLRQILETEGYEVEAAADGVTALEMLREKTFQLVITDLRMPDMSGFELLSTLRKERVPVGVIVLTAYGDTSEALRTMKAGADDFLSKPCDADHLRLVVARTIERRRLFDELSQLRNQLRGSYSFHTMVSQSAKMRKVFDLIQHVGPLDSTILIHGETGTGKELVAQALHAVNTRRKGSFVALNCAVLNDSLLESELFGHERGSFTGAEKRKIGRFEKADGGTLLLDEIGDISPAMQAKLLRVLQSGTIERVGGTDPIKVDVRIIAATHKRLEDEVRAGRFRADLYYRLKVILIDLPPLRDRKEDIPLLALNFVEKHNSAAATPVAEFDWAAMQALLQHQWPGNVRELENAVKSAVALAEGSVIHRDDLPETVAPRSASRLPGPSLIDIETHLPELTEDLIGQVEREYFQRVLAEYGGNVARCARHSGLSRRSVTQKLQKYSLERATFKKPRVG
ncbi:MAG: sigma-54 dependent transcriptional regulator [Paludisphaera borealis]|uniref:sigma-54-dependent transcriptional regulator n=1 Tax=Paludisphaera borealis TaxID=1387353 RepID=UPI0028441D33|nr:sigma-54 dependent transcriptional regulator [Paludisphaera borealis]MDR3619822.1 sigma-54 dependent transcriptional regulator [Paludisphaera borealis]